MVRVLLKVVESLNEKYKDLDSNQKNLLKEYINSISNTNSLKTLIAPNESQDSEDAVENA